MPSYIPKIEKTTDPLQRLSPRRRHLAGGLLARIDFQAGRLWLRSPDLPTALAADDLYDLRLIDQRLIGDDLLIARRIGGGR